jgi:hypothetical protein
MNKLKEGQIYTLNNGETYDVIHRHWEDGSGSWCYEIVLMKRKIRGRKFTWDKKCIGCVLDWEDCAIDEIRKRGVLVGEIGKTHFYNPENHYKLEAMNE